MNTDPQQILADVDAALADLPAGPDPATAESDPALATGEGDGIDDIDDVEAIDAIGRRLEQAHQILVDALESVEKG